MGFFVQDLKHNMKKGLLILVAALGLQQAYAQGTMQTQVIVQDSISTDTHWTRDYQYLLKGFVYVTSGHTLTIDSGIVIKGDKNTKGTLIVERGAKIYANGTPNMPIIFTSAQAPGNRSYGDWGGLIICGNAPVNWTAGQAQVEGGPRSFYGGTDPLDNSGKLSYVRIEFPGVALSPNNEVNGLTLCGVGKSTQIDHIQIYKSGDDGFEFFGGNVNAKYLICTKSWDDDFDTDNGYSGKIQFGAVMRDPYAADVSGSKAFESDAYGTGTATGLAGDTSMITKPVFSNMTLIGPMVNTTATIDPQYVAGIQIRRGSGLSLVNSVIAGWPCGILLDESSSAFGSTIANLGTGMLQIRNNIIAGTATNSTPNPKDIVYVFNGARSLTPTTANSDSTLAPFSPYAGPWSFLKTPAFKNAIYGTVQTGVRLTDPFNSTYPNLVPLTNSPISSGTAVFNSVTRTFSPALPINYDTTNNGANWNVPTNAPDFTTTKAADPFFTPVNYIGAFSGTQTTADNWMAGWATFTAETNNYDLIVGVNEVDMVNSLTVYPNPAPSQAYVRIDMKDASDLTITMTDITGKIIKTIASGKKGLGLKTIAIDLSDVQNGLYIVNAVSGTAQKSVKLSVIK
jgi:hypothetical protein